MHPRNCGVDGHAPEGKTRLDYFLVRKVSCLSRLGLWRRSLHGTRRLPGWRGRAWQRKAGVIVAAGAVLTAAAAVLPARAGAVPARAAAAAFVRVNQIGYATASQAKRAYLMASTAETGARFSVKNASGTTVYSAPIGVNLGKW